MKRRSVDKMKIKREKKLTFRLKKLDLEGIRVIQYSEFARAW